MKTPEKKKRGGKRCTAALCSNTYQNEVSLHYFPKDEELAKRWSSQVKKTRADWTKHSKHSVICSNHLEADCFEQGPLLAAAFGLETKRRRILKPDAVPTVFAKPTPSPTPSTTTSVPSVAATTPRSAYIKRDRKRVSSEYWQ